MIRVLIADDHPVVRSGLAAVLGSLDGFEVVAVAANGADAVRECVINRPDVALMDLKMPGVDGFHAIRELARVAPTVAVCVLTMLDDDDSLFTAMRCGARGYLLKGAEQGTSPEPSAASRPARWSSGRGWRAGSWASSALLRPPPARRSRR
jgi:DNA-binding NarL/FixJ family response regulator